MANIDFNLEDPRWRDHDLEAIGTAACAATLAHLGLPGDFEISVLGCGDARIAELNAGFRGKTAPTNVLSWPSVERAPVRPGADPAPPEVCDAMQAGLGDIAIAWDTCAREAEQAGIPMADHVTHLMVHATLHLLGYDHINDAGAARMEELETAILANLGLPDPYRQVPCDDAR
jgi:probable rRNA maturation factor